MKIRTVILALALAFAAVNAQAKTIEMQVNGLVCAFCAQGITKKMKGNAATQDVFVSLENKLVAVELKKDQDIADPALKKLITDAGYSLVAIKRTDTPVATLRSKFGSKKK